MTGSPRGRQTPSSREAHARPGALEPANVGFWSFTARHQQDQRPGVSARGSIQRDERRPRSRHPLTRGLLGDLKQASNVRVPKPGIEPQQDQKPLVRVKAGKRLPRRVRLLHPVDRLLGLVIQHQRPTPGPATQLVNRQVGGCSLKPGALTGPIAFAWKAPPRPEQGLLPEILGCFTITAQHTSKSPRQPVLLVTNKRLEIHRTQLNEPGRRNRTKPVRARYLTYGVGCRSGLRPSQQARISGASAASADGASPVALPRPRLRAPSACDGAVPSTRTPAERVSALAGWPAEPRELRRCKSQPSGSTPRPRRCPGPLLADAQLLPDPVQMAIGGRRPGQLRSSNARRPRSPGAAAGRSRGWEGSPQARSRPRPQAAPAPRDARERSAVRPSRPSGPARQLTSQRCRSLDVGTVTPQLSGRQRLRLRDDGAVTCSAAPASCFVQQVQHSAPGRRARTMRRLAALPRSSRVPRVPPGGPSQESMLARRCSRRSAPRPAVPSPPSTRPGARSRRLYPACGRPDYCCRSAERQTRLATRATAGPAG